MFNCLWFTLLGISHTHLQSDPNKNHVSRELLFTFDLWVLFFKYHLFIYVPCRANRILLRYKSSLRIMRRDVTKYIYSSIVPKYSFVLLYFHFLLRLTFDSTTLFINFSWAWRAKKSENSFLNYIFIGTQLQKQKNVTGVQTRIMARW